MLKRQLSAHLHNSLTSKKFCAERMQRQGNSQKKSSSQGEDFFASCLLVHKLCLIFTSYLATHKLFLTLQAVCRHKIVSIFANCLVIHNFFNLQVVCFQTITLIFQAVCRHTIVSIFANCLVIHNCFYLQVVCFQAIALTLQAVCRRK